MDGRLANLLIEDNATWLLSTTHNYISRSAQLCWFTLPIIYNFVHCRSFTAGQCRWTVL